MSKQSKYILLFGATGFVGEKIIEELLSKGYSPIVITRNLQNTTRYIQIQGDLDHAEKITKQIQKYKIFAMIYLMGIIKEKNDATFKKIHFEWLVAACGIAREMRIKRVIYMSANGAKENGTKYQNTKYQGEQYLANSPFVYTIFRPSIIADRDLKHYNFLRVLENQLRFGIVPIIGDGTYSISPVTRNDIAKIFTLSLEEKKTFFRTFSIGGSTYTYKNLLTKLAASRNKKIIPLSLPVGLMKATIFLFGWLPFFPITKDQLTMLLEGNVVNDSSIWKILGIRQQKIDTIISADKK